jgi:hypothetical protein
MRSQALLAYLLVSGATSLTLGILGACGSTSSLAPDSGPSAPPACITDVQKQNGESCKGAPEGYVCPVGFPCTDPPISQQASCTCTSGKWQCSYTAGDGGMIAPGTAPVCVPGGEGMQGACPTNESQNQSCKVAGLICSYAGETCKGSTAPNTDTCQCVAGPDAGQYDTGTGLAPVVTSQLVWSCDRDLCDPTSDATVPPPPDAGPPDTGPEHDAQADSAG